MRTLRHIVYVSCTVTATLLSLATVNYIRCDGRCVTVPKDVLEHLINKCSIQVMRKA